MRDQRGSQSVEFMGVLPLLVLVAAVIWQTALAGHALLVAEVTARSAAQAAAAARDPVSMRAAAHRAADLARGTLRLDGAPQVDLVDGQEVRVTVRILVPVVGRRSSALRLPLGRTVTMPWDQW